MFSGLLGWFFFGPKLNKPPHVGGRCSVQRLGYGWSVGLGSRLVGDLDCLEDHPMTDVSVVHNHGDSKYVP